MSLLDKDNVICLKLVIKLVSFKLVNFSEYKSAVVQSGEKWPSKVKPVAKS